MEIVFALDSQPPSDAPDRPNAELRFDYNAGGRSSVKVPGPWKRGRPRGSIKEKPVDSTVKDVSPFHFINVAEPSKGIDPASRASIRKYASRSKKPRSNPTSMSAAQGTLTNHPYRMSWPQQIEGVDPFDVSCIRLEPYMHDLLFYLSTTIWTSLYSLERGGLSNVMTDYWLPLAFQDAALMHSIIACANSFATARLRASRRTAVVDTRQIRHVQASISIINDRLAEATATSKVSMGTLAVVAGMALHGIHEGRYEYWKMHMNGLKVLVDIAGGLQTFHAEPMIIDKICRADLCGSLEFSQKPMFYERLPSQPTLPRDENPSTPLLPASSSLTRQQQLVISFPSSADIVSLIPDSPILQACLRDLEKASTSALWTSSEASIADQAVQVRAVLLRVQYTLASTTPLGSDPDQQQSFLLDNMAVEQNARLIVAEFVRLTLILYTTSILMERPSLTSVCKKIALSFAQIVERLTTQESSPHPLPPADFLLWATFLATNNVAMAEREAKDLADDCGSALTKKLKSDLSDIFMQLATAPGGVSREKAPQGVKSRLSSYLWVSQVHDLQFEELWAEISL